MTSSTAFAPPMYPETDDHIRPVPPVRVEYSRNAQQEHLLPQIPKRMDDPDQNTSTISREVIEQITDAALRRKECSCNYNRYATKKTIGHGFLEIALLTSNAMQLRTLIGQKHHDGIWIASLVLVTLSVIAQIGLAFILVILGKGDIQNPHKQEKLERYNNLVLFITILISMINVIINAFMTTTSSTSYVDQSLLDSLKVNN